MFGISGFKLVIILVAALIFLGPDKMPEIGRTIGKALRMFQAAKDDMQKVISAEMDGESKSKDLAASSPSVASTLYADDDEEGEEEE